MAINKVIFGNQTLMDTTGVTVTPNNMTRGTTALAANGETITGVLDTAPLYNDLDKTSEGYALDARQGKALNDKIVGLGNPVTIPHGGTGAATASGARTNLNVYSKDEIEEKISLSSTVGPTNIASIDDGLEMNATDLEINIKPVQDLHGYDHPWPTGGGKNLLPMTVDGIKSANSSATWNGNSTTINGVTFTIQIDNDGNVVGINVSGTASGDSQSLYLAKNVALADGSYVLNGCPNNGSLQSYGIYADYSSGGNIPDYGSGATLNVSNVTLNLRVRIANGYTASKLVFKPMIRLASESDATFAPYSNICPISGWTGAKVTRTGFNVWDEEWEVGGYKGSDGTPDYSATSWIMSKPNKPITVKEGVPYYLKKYGYWMYYDENDNYLHYTAGTNKTIPSNVKYLRFCIPNYFTNGITTYNHDICINISDPARNGTYEPGHVVTYPISWQSEAGTVYGGTLDVTTGLLTVTMAEVDLGTLDWVYSVDLLRFDGATLTNLSTNRTACICSQYRASNVDIGWADKDKVCCIYSTRNSVFIKDTAYTDAASFKAAMSGVKLVYELATPITYQLTPTEVEMLLGVNNVWADTGNVTITYRKNDSAGVNREILNLAQNIQKINKPTYTDMVADSQIASNKYFIIGNNLYLSTTAISAGSAIIPGTNCILTNLAEALNAINT